MNNDKIGKKEFFGAGIAIIAVSVSIGIFQGVWNGIVAALVCVVLGALLYLLALGKRLFLIIALLITFGGVVLGVLRPLVVLRVIFPIFPALAIFCVILLIVYYHEQSKKISNDKQNNEKFRTKLIQVAHSSKLVSILAISGLIAAATPISAVVSLAISSHQYSLGNGSDIASGEETAGDAGDGEETAGDAGDGEETADGIII